MEEDIREVPNRAMYEHIDTLVIDEISMVRADLLDAIDKFMRINGRDCSKPFEGIQIVFFGDLFQLSPIVADPEENLYLIRQYGSPWFFDSYVMKHLSYKLVELKKVYRQKGHEFIKLLDMIRTGDFENLHLNIINERFHVGEHGNLKEPNITLTSTNRLAAQINNEKLNKLDSPEFIFLGTIEGDYPMRSLPTDLTLRLKKGAQIMFVKNDVNRRWVNGTIGKINDIDNDLIKVEIQKNGDSFVYPASVEKWEVLKYRFNQGTNKLETEVVGSFTQYPLRLAWAVTIHKSQGLTFENVIIDLGNGAFTHGQTYVALSRCITLDGIVLKTKINRNDIRVDPTVKRYFSDMNRMINT